MVQRFFFHCVAALVFFAATVASVPAFAEEEYTVKAAFMVGFTKFIEWPDGNDIRRKSKTDICVLGDSDISNAAHKLSITLVKERNIANVASHCYMLFVSASESDRLDDVLATLKNQPVLTVGDSPDFAEHGGMIGFVLNENRIRFVVNKDSIQHAGLRVDSQMLEIALRVIDK